MNVVVSLTKKVRIVELPRISCKKTTGLTSLKGLRVSPFNESENSKGVKVKPLFDRNNFVVENNGIKVNPLNDVKSCIEDKISPDKESYYMEYKPFISEDV